MGVVLSGSVVACSGGEEDDQGGSLEDGVRVSGKSLEVFGGLEADEVTYRNGLAYARVRNETGVDGNLFRVGIDFFDAQGEEIGGTNTFCKTKAGGSTVRDGDVIHCMYYLDLEQIPTTAALGFVEADEVHDFAPNGVWQVVGEPTYGDEGSTFGYVEAEVCRRQGVSSIHEDASIEAFVLDADGFPWDWGTSPRAAVGGDGCGIFRAGELDMPEDPVVVAVP